MFEIRKITARVLIIIWSLIGTLVMGGLAVVTFAYGDEFLGILFLLACALIVLIAWGMWGWKRWALWVGLLVTTVGMGFSLLLIQHVGIQRILFAMIWLFYFLLPRVRILFY